MRAPSTGKIPPSGRCAPAGPGWSPGCGMRIAAHLRLLVRRARL